MLRCGEAADIDNILLALLAATNSGPPGMDTAEHCVLLLPQVEPSTEVKFISFQSGVFTKVALVNPPDGKLVKSTTVT